MANDTAVGQYTGPVLGLGTPPRPYPKNPLDPNDPNYDPVLDPHSPQYNPQDPRLVGGTSTYLSQYGPPSQQPTTPINTAQGSPQRLQSTPNSAPLVGGSPNMALTNGSGYPMGGLPTQQPMAELSDFNHMNMAQPISGPDNPFVRAAQMKRQQQMAALLARFRQSYNLGQR